MTEHSAGIPGDSGGGDHRLTLRFHGDLDFFLSPGAGRRHYDVRRRASVKDIIQSSGVPHTEVGEICHNRRIVDFSFIPETGGRLTVRPVSPPFDVCSGTRLRPEPMDAVRFIADLNVLKLGRYLLFLGYDVRLAFDLPDEGIAAAARRERRIVLTRDTRLLFRRNVVFARRIRRVSPMDQLKEVLTFFGLKPSPVLFFTRCVRCNEALEPVEKKEILHRLEPKTRKYFHRFLRCPGCRQIFWKGSHYDRILDRFRASGVLKTR